MRNYDNFKLADNGEISYVYKRIDLDNVNERLRSAWEIRRLGVAKLKSMGFINITDEDINPYKPKYKKEGLDKQLRMIRGSLKVAIAKHISLEGRIKQNE